MLFVAQKNTGMPNQDFVSESPSWNVAAVSRRDGGGPTTAADRLKPAANEKGTNSPPQRNLTNLLSRVPLVNNRSTPAS